MPNTGLITDHNGYQSKCDREPVVKPTPDQLEGGSNPTRTSSPGTMLHMLQGDPNSQSPGQLQHSNYGESFLQQTKARLASAHTTDHTWLLLEEVDYVIKHCPQELQSEFQKLILKYESSVFEEGISVVASR